MGDGNRVSKENTGFAARLSPRALGLLRADPDVAYIEADGIVTIDTTQSNPTWGLDRIDQRALPLSTTYTYNNTGAGVTAYIIDTGILTSHTQFGGRATVGYDSFGGNGIDCNGHGTHVAGTIAARDNGTGVVGVAPEAELYALKVLNASGSGRWSDIIAALQWAAKNSIEVTNNSYGSDQNPGGTVQAAFDNSAAVGVLHVAAAGNSGTPAGTGDKVGYPARYSSVIAVAATDSSDRRASFSSTGPAVELAAPGVGINSTLRGGGYGGDQRPDGADGIPQGPDMPRPGARRDS